MNRSRACGRFSTLMDNRTDAVIQIIIPLMQFSIARLCVVVLLVAFALAIAQNTSVIPALLLTYTAGFIAILILVKTNRWNVFLASFAISVFVLLLGNEFLCWSYSIKYRGPTPFPKRFQSAYPFLITLGFLWGMIGSWIVAGRWTNQLQSNNENRGDSQDAG